MKNKNVKMVFVGLALVSLNAYGQRFQKSYIAASPDSKNFATTVRNWEYNHHVNDDDNFFISRVKPKTRIRNANTQVNPEMKKENDKRLVAWLPYDDPDKNALPDGVFDSEVFSMWQYVDHWGDWSAPLGRIPAALLDVAHKNGVAVSSVASVPFGYLSSDWERALTAYGTLDATKTAKFLAYYGIDGLGYNSEWNGAANVVRGLQTLHEALVKEAKKTNPIFENMWYDGTQSNGYTSFDKGLTSRNQENFGANGQERASLFFNYNWNKAYLLQASKSFAEGMKRDPQYLYCGINMQGGEPHNGKRWTMIKDYPLGIGLWGAHARNMFWESRGEKGSAPETKQRTYMQRIERWFTGGTRNPANCPEFGDALSYHADNFDFQGMSPMMTAKSTLGWDLKEEPFVTHFNLGNGKFFNWNGERKNDREWANVGVQDYLPTWRWWFSKSLLGGKSADVLTDGLKADFVWDEAYFGGSTVRIYGNTTAEYLHLFKTAFDLKSGDKITVKYKVSNGASNMKLVLTAKDAEKNEVAYALSEVSDIPDGNKWVEKTFVVGNDFDSKTLALVALKFENAANLDLYLGEFSIVRGEWTKPEKPQITKGELLAFNANGVDGKLIFKMPNDKAQDEPCYNQDVKTSLFKLYAQEEGKDQVLVGTTTSWAALYYQIPVNVTNNNLKVRLGVSAVSLDMKSESEIAWTDYKTAPSYKYSDDVKADKTVIKPNEAFTLSYVDPRHPSGTWTIKDTDGKVVFTGSGTSVNVNTITKAGVYNLEINGQVSTDHGTATETRVLGGYVQVTGPEVGTLPKINTLTANESESDVTVDTGASVALKYTGKSANGNLSRGIKIEEKGVGFKTNAAGFSSMQKAWTVSFWVKFNSIADGGTQILDMRDQEYAGWPRNNWGSFWSTYYSQTRELEFTIRNNKSESNPEHKTTWDVHFVPGVWTHIAFTMEKGANGVREFVYINGKKATATKWKYGDSQVGSGENPKYQSPGAYWESNDQSFMLIGYGRHQTAGMDATLDDVKFFDKQLDDSEVAKAMYATDLSDNPTAFWDFEKEATTDNMFEGKGSNPFNIMALTTIKGSAEGQAAMGARKPSYDAGCPFSKGTAFALTTTPKWSTNRGTVVPVSGTDTEGAATVSYPVAGDYEVTLTLENSYGKDTKTFKVIHVNSATGITGAQTNELNAYTVGDEVFVECAENGNYTFSVYAIDGTQVLGQNVNVTSDNVVKLRLATAGIYVLKVQKDGKLVRTVKLMRK